MTTVKFLIGCDPEVFLKTKSGKPASAHGILPGNKSEPFKTKKGAIQVDGMAAEFNTDPVPLDDFERFNAAIIAQIRAIREMVPDNLSLSIVPTQEFGKEFLDTQPDEAKELGCDPDFCAYTLKPNPRPDADNSTFRTGAGHIHIGWGADIPIENEEHIQICADFVKMLDQTVGMYMTLLDTDPLRRELYGKAGAFRPKPYGVEYRTPSNVWIKNRDSRSVVHALVNLAIYLHRNVYYQSPLKESYYEEIINTGDTEKAKNVLRACSNYIGTAVKNKINSTTGEDVFSMKNASLGSPAYFATPL